jgi:hypothetical protein
MGHNGAKIAAGPTKITFIRTSSIVRCSTMPSRQTPRHFRDADLSKDGSGVVKLSNIAAEQFS